MWRCCAAWLPRAPAAPCGARPRASASSPSTPAPRGAPPRQRRQGSGWAGGGSSVTRKPCSHPAQPPTHPASGSRKRTSATMSAQPPDKPPPSMCPPPTALDQVLSERSRSLEVRQQVQLDLPARDGIIKLEVGGARGLGPGPGGGGGQEPRLTGRCYGMPLRSVAMPRQAVPHAVACVHAMHCS